MREPPHHGRGQHRKARHSGQTEHTGRARLRVERADAGDELRAVGEIEIVHARRDARLDEAVTRGAVTLKRPARVDDDGRRERGELRRDVAVAVERRRLELRGGPARADEILGAAATSAPRRSASAAARLRAAATIRPPNTP